MAQWTFNIIHAPPQGFRVSHVKINGIVTPRQEPDPGSLPSSGVPKAGYLPLRFLQALRNGPIVIVPLPSFRWEMNTGDSILTHIQFQSFVNEKSYDILKESESCTGRIQHLDSQQYFS